MIMTPNLNGASTESLIEQLSKIYDAAMALLDRLSDGRPHGRDYQMRADSDAALREDRAEWDQFYFAVDAWMSRIQDEIIQLASGG